MFYLLACLLACLLISFLVAIISFLSKQFINKNNDGDSCANTTVNYDNDSFHKRVQIIKEYSMPFCLISEINHLRYLNSCNSNSYNLKNHLNRRNCLVPSEFTGKGQGKRVLHFGLACANVSSMLDQHLENVMTLLCLHLLLAIVLLLKDFFTHNHCEQTNV